MSVFGRFLPVMLLGLATTVAGAGDAVRFPASPSAVVGSRDSTSTIVAASRGALLYENHCTVCHTSVVHIRDNRKAKSIADLNGWVARWSGELKLNWSDEVINEVAEFLARRFYKFGKQDKG